MANNATQACTSPVEWKSHYSSEINFHCFFFFFKLTYIKYISTIHPSILQFTWFSNNDYNCALCSNLVVNLECELCAISRLRDGEAGGGGGARCGECVLGEKHLSFQKSSDKSAATPPSDAANLDMS